MPSIITREGVVIHQEELTQEQKEQGWAIVFRRFLELHPEVLNMGGQEAAEPSTSSVGGSNPTPPSMRPGPSTGRIPPYRFVN